MGTLKTTIQLEDKVSSRLKNINRNIGKTVSAMARLNQVMTGLEGGSLGKAVGAWSTNAKNAINSVAQAQKTASKMAHDHQKSLDKRMEKMADARVAKQIEGAKTAGRIALANARLENQITLERQRQAHWQERQNARLREQAGIYNRIQRIASRIRNIMTLWYTAQMGIQGIGAAVGLSDRMTMAEARLGLMADSKTSVGDIEAKAFGAAQRSTTDYLEFTKAVSKMGILAGDKFADQDSVIRFTELMNKQFQVGGAELSERNAAMLQLTQAIASNRLGGDELRTIRETAPLLVKYIQKSLNVGEAEFKKLAKEGEITADVIIKAMAESSAELEKMYANLPLTWERVWTRMKNVGVMAFKPIQEQLKRLFNNKKFLTVMNKITDSMIVLGKVGGWALKTLFDGLGLLYDGLKRVVNGVKALLPAFTSLAISVGIVSTAYAIWWGWTKRLVAWNAILYGSQWAMAWITTIATMGTKAFAFAVKVLTGVTKIQVVWQTILNALTMNWVAIIITIVIVALALLIYWIYKMSDSWADAMGKIWGACVTVFAAIVNLVIGVIVAIIQFIGARFVNPIISIIEFVLNTFKGGFDTFRDWFENLMGQMIAWLFDFAKVATVIIDAVFGSDWTSKIQELQTHLRNTGKNDKAITLKRIDMSNVVADNRWSYQDAYKTGYDQAYGFVGKIEGAFNDIGAEWDKLNKLDLDMEKTKLEALKGIAGNGKDANDLLNGINKSGEQTAKNTAHEEDYSYLREWSYQRGLGGSIGYNIKIEQNNRNNIASGLDVSSIVNAVLDGIVDGLNNNAERGIIR